jgi:hypothetical protein
MYHHQRAVLILKVQTSLFVTNNRNLQNTRYTLYQNSSYTLSATLLIVKVSLSNTKTKFIFKLYNIYLNFYILIYNHPACCVYYQIIPKRKNEWQQVIT